MRFRPLFLAAMVVLLLFNISFVSLDSSPEPIPLETEQVSFTNVTWDAGLKGVGGHFLAWGDYNNDGFLDLLVNGGRLFENNGPPTWNFTDVSGQVGISGGSYGTWADWNNDGFLDMYVAGSDKLYSNNGPPGYSFSDVTAQSGIMKESHSTGCGWGDYDNDGDVDLFKIRGEDWDNSLYFPNSFWRNNGNGTFTNVTAEAGVDESSDPKYGRGCAWADYNYDGWLDIYISNYRQQINYLYENQGDGTFIDVAPQKGVADGPPYGEGGNVDPYDRAGHGVGSVWGDYDNDGYFDLWVTNLNHKDARTSDDSLLYHSDGPPEYTFTNVRDESDIHIKPYVAPNEGDELFVGCTWGDYDNDGDIDLYLPQIYDNSYAYSFLYSNDGDGTFTDVTVEAGVRVWDTYAGCWADYDNDGDLDLVTSGRDGGGEDPVRPHFVHLFRNEGASGNWLHLDIRGNGENTNTAGIGTTVSVTTDSGLSQIKQIEGGMGPHGMQNSLILEFGFGEYTGTVDVEIIWTGGEHQTLDDIGINRAIGLEEGTAAIETLYGIDIETIELDYIFQDGTPAINPLAGSMLKIRGKVINNGDYPLESAFLNFYYGSPSSGNLIAPAQQIVNLPPGENIMITLDWDTSAYSGLTDISIRVEGSYPGEVLYDNNEMDSQIYLNYKPVAAWEVPVTDTVEGQLITFDASNSTDETYVSEYYFDFGDETSSWTTSAVVQHAYKDWGGYTASLIVKDEHGALSTNEVVESISVKSIPTAVIEVSSDSVLLGDSITFDGRDSSDKDGYIDSYHFDFGDGESSDWIPDSTVEHTYTSAGFYNANLRVKDDDGFESTNVASVSISVTKPTNLPPVAYIDSIIPSSAALGIPVQFSGHGQDDDGTITDYEWSSDLDGELSSAPEFTTSELSVGEHTITFRVRDNLGDWSDEAERFLKIKLENLLPTLEIISPSDFEDVSGVVVISGVAEDDDGDIVRVEVRVDEGAWEEAQGTTAWSYSLNTSNLADGEHTISARAFDGEEYSDITAISIIVAQEEKSDGEGELDTIFIFAIVIGIIGTVLVLAAALGRYIKKENEQVPPGIVEVFQPAEPPQEPPPARMNW